METARGGQILGQGIAHELRLSANSHAVSVLAQFARGDFGLVDLLCGISLELAIKARLAEVSPVFLAEKSANWFKQGLALMSPNPIAVQNARTVGAVEAIDRLVEIDRNVATVRDLVVEFSSVAMPSPIFLGLATATMSKNGYLDLSSHLKR
jgi:hypothetical protein